MRQLTKEVYETPLTTKRVVTMESSCMAASNEKIVQEDNTSADITKQGGFDEGAITFGQDAWGSAK